MAYGAHGPSRNGPDTVRAKVSQRTIAGPQDAGTKVDRRPCRMASRCTCSQAESAQTYARFFRTRISASQFRSENVAFKCI